MAKKSRPSLTSLSDRFAKKEGPSSPAAAPAVDKATIAKSDERVQVLVRMTVAERKALRQIALDQDTTVQALVEENLRDLLQRHGVS